MPIKPLFKDEEAVAVAVWAWTSVPVLHSTRVRFDKFLYGDIVAVIFILNKIALYYVLLQIIGSYNHDLILAG